MRVVVFLFLLFAAVAGAGQFKILKARYVARGGGDCLVCGKSTRTNEAVWILIDGAPPGFVHIGCSGIQEWNPWLGARRSQGERID